MLNLTQHAGTPEQKKLGLVDLEDTDYLKALLTYTTQPPPVEILNRVKKLIDIAKSTGHKEVLVAGPMYFTIPFELALRSAGMIPYYAHSEPKKTIDPVTGKQQSVFEFKGFYEGMGEVPKTRGLSDKGYAGRRVVITDRAAEDYEKFGYTQNNKLSEAIISAMRVVEVPTKKDIQARVKGIVQTVKEFRPPIKMLCIASGACPAILPPLTTALTKLGIITTFPYSERVSKEVQVAGPEGTIVKKETSFYLKGLVNNPVSVLPEYLKPERLSELPDLSRFQR